MNQDLQIIVLDDNATVEKQKIIPKHGIHICQTSMKHLWLVSDGLPSNEPDVHYLSELLAVHQ